jgi:hypothetical protein
VFAGINGTYAPALASSSTGVTVGDENSIITLELPSDATDYDVYVIVCDPAGNFSNLVKVDILTPPAVT